MKNIFTFFFLLLGVTAMQGNPNTNFNEVLYSTITKHAAEHPTTGEITVLFAYTKYISMDCGGAQAIKKKVDNGMKLLNEALVNSNIGYRAKAIVEYVEVDITKSTTDKRAELNELMKVDGKYNKVHQYRKQKQADIVCLIINGNKGGVANLNGQFMVCDLLNSFNSTWIFPHEFGHNLGAEHSPKPMGNKYRFEFEGAMYPFRTVSNNGGWSIPYFSEDRTITYTFEYQDSKDNFKPITKTKTIKIGGPDYNNAAKMRTQAPKTARYGEELKDVTPVANAYGAKLVTPATAPSQEIFKLINFKFDETTKMSSFTYNATECFIKTQKRAYRVQAINSSGKVIPKLGEFFEYLAVGQSNTVNVSFQKQERYELKSGSTLQLLFQDNGEDDFKLIKEIKYGAPVVFSSPDDLDFIESFSVNESNGHITIKHKTTQETAPFEVKIKRQDGSKAGGTSSKLYKNKTEFLIDFISKRDAGTTYELYLKGKLVKTYIIGKGAINNKPITSNPTNPIKKSDFVTNSDMTTKSFTVDKQGHVKIIFKVRNLNKKIIPYVITVRPSDGSKAFMVEKNVTFKSIREEQNIIFNDISGPQPKGTIYTLAFNRRIVLTYTVPDCNAKSTEKLSSYSSRVTLFTVNDQGQIKVRFKAPQEFLSSKELLMTVGVTPPDCGEPSVSMRPIYFPPSSLNQEKEIVLNSKPKPAGTVYSLAIGNKSGTIYEFLKIYTLPSVRNTLKIGETLHAGEQLISENGAYMLSLQSNDGHLCIYKYNNNTQGSFVWGSMKYGFKNAKLTLQSDGHLVVYGGANNYKWSSKTHPNFNAKFNDARNKPVKLVLENNGEINLYNTSGQVVWSSSDKNTLNVGESLKAGEKLISENGAYMLSLQSNDGHLCIYKYNNRQQGSFVWGSMKYGFKNGRLTLQSDGNLVIYDGANSYKWSSSTHPQFDAKFKNPKNKPVRLVLENNGKINLYNANNQVMWSSH